MNTDSIRDELDEVITLNSVSIIVAEYIPFGANQIVQLNSNVGSTERVQGGFISPAVDEDSSGTSMEMSPEMTAVDILDYTLTNHINFEAEIRFAEVRDSVSVSEVFRTSSSRRWRLDDGTSPRRRRRGRQSVHASRGGGRGGVVIV